MKISTSKVVGGKVIVEDDPLHECSAVTMLVPENDETFAASAEQEVELLAASRKLIAVTSSAQNSYWKAFVAI